MVVEQKKTLIRAKRGQLGDQVQLSCWIHRAQGRRIDEIAEKLNKRKSGLVAEALQLLFNAYEKMGY